MAIRVVDLGESDSVQQPIKRLLTEYKLSLEAANRRPKTISGYIDILHRLSSHLEMNGLTKSVIKLGRQELEDYIRHLKNSSRWPNRPNTGKDRGELSAITIQDHVRAIKIFWSWLFDNGYIEKNTLAKFPLPKIPKTIIKTLTIEQMQLFLKAIDKHTSVGARNFCITLLMIDNGMRISEVVAIQIVDLDLTRCRVKIIGKGQKERIVPFTKITRKELMKYIKHHREDLCSLDSPYLFPANDSGHVSIKSIQQSIKRIANKAGPHGIRCHAHLFRHTFATLFLAKGGNPMVLKDIMGHESMQTTQKYVHFLPEDLQKQHWTYSPVEDLFK